MNELRRTFNQAVALRYDKAREGVPRVVAKGKGAIAERILQVAREHNIPIQSDPDLLELLAAVDLDDLIPVEAYRVVAEVFAFLYRINKAEAPE